MSREPEKEGTMLRKLVGICSLALLLLLPGIVVGQGETVDRAFVRVLQVANDNTAVALTLQDGRTVLSSFLPGSVSAYFPYETDRSTQVTLTITPPGGISFAREWLVPPLAPGYHTIAVVGTGRDSTLDLIFIDEDALCEGKLEAGSCLIFVNNLKNAPALNLNANSARIIEESRYRQVTVAHIPAASYFNFTVVEQNNPQSAVFRAQLQFFEPNVIYLYSLRGVYPSANLAAYQVGTVRRVPTDSMTFLRSLTADLNLSDGDVLFAAENITAVLEQTGFDQLLTNSRLPLTIFAPLDEAVIEGARDLFDCAIADPAAMRALILNHILVGDYSIRQLVEAGQVTTLSGVTHTFRSAGGGFTIDNIVEVSDRLSYTTSNGTVYLIDDLLVPPNFENDYCTQG